MVPRDDASRTGDARQVQDVELSDADIRS